MGLQEHYIMLHVRYMVVARWVDGGSYSGLSGVVTGNALPCSFSQRQRRWWVYQSIMGPMNMETAT